MATTFRLWDAVVLACCQVASIFLLYRIYVADLSKHELDRRLGGDISEGKVILLGAIAGMLCAGPIILGSQWVRGRTLRFRLGEYLWLIPTLLYFIIYALSRTIHVHETSYAVACLGWVLLQVVASLASLCVLTCVLTRRNLLWTEVLGSLTCASFGIAVVYFIGPYLPF